MTEKDFSKFLKQLAKDKKEATALQSTLSKSTALTKKAEKIALGAKKEVLQEDD